MPAYIIVELSVTDQQRYEAYKSLAAASVAFFGGKYIVRGGQTECLEGDWQPERIVVLEFPTVERVKEWYNSEMYTKVKSIRLEAAITKMILIEGV